MVKEREEAEIKSKLLPQKVDSFCRWKGGTPGSWTTRKKFKISRFLISKQPLGFYHVPDAIN